MIFSHRRFVFGRNQKIWFQWFTAHGSPSTGRSNWILHRKMKYSICCLRDVILEIERQHPKYRTSISGVKFSWTTCLRSHFHVLFSINITNLALRARLSATDDAQPSLAYHSRLQIQLSLHITEFALEVRQPRNWAVYTRWGIWPGTWLGLTLFSAVPQSYRICRGRWKSGSIGTAAWQGGGTVKIIVNPTQVRYQMPHPVFLSEHNVI